MNTLIHGRTGHEPRGPARSRGRSCGLLATLLLLSSPAFTQDGKTGIREVYLRHLRAEGYVAEPTDQGNLKFKREGRTYTIVVDDADASYFVLAAGFRADTKSPEARLRHLEAANFATRTTKVAKAYIDADGDLVFAVETVQPTPADVIKALPRMFRMIDLAVQKVSSRLQE